MKQKTCKSCKQKFTPERNFQNTCSISCAIQYAKNLKEKRDKNAKKVCRRALKQFNDSDINLLKRKAQKACNDYIRLRDKDLPCISCGYAGNERQWHAGHFKSRGGNSALMYDENNIHKTCIQCNVFKAGNLVPYRKNLIKKIGIDEVNKLEETNQIKKWSIEEIKEIINYYKLKIKNI